MTNFIKLGPLVLGFALSASVFAADATDVAPVAFALSTPVASTLNIPPVQPRMSPELALKTYEQRSDWQARDLGEYEDVTTIEAELPKTAQRGRFQLHRTFAAPKSLIFKPQSFSGDGFVKTNVIARILQSEVDHVQKGDNAEMAINAANYKFSYKGTDVVNGEPVHVFHVKPRHKRTGLFKGKIFLDAHTGAILRAEGTAVKSPSFFIKKIEFVQDYAQIGVFSLVSHIHSTAQTRIVGPAVVDVTHDDYQAHSVNELQSNLDAIRGMAPDANGRR